MKCRNCGAELEDDALFCTKCGTLTDEQYDDVTEIKVEETIEPDAVINKEGTIEQKVDKKNETISAEDNKKANTLCAISLALAIVPWIIRMVSVIMIESEIIYKITRVIEPLITVFQGFASIAALTLMIFVRVKYPKNTFGKVLMWLYIAYAILTVITMIIAIIAFIACINSCKGMPG